MWCSFAATTTAQIPSNKLIANDSSDTTIVASSTRTGIKYQRGAPVVVSREAVILAVLSLPHSVPAKIRQAANVGALE